MKGEDALNILKMLTETPLAEVIQCLNDGKFDQVPVERDCDNKTVIGELTAFEKAVLTVRNRYHEKAIAIIETNDAMFQLWEKNGQPVDGNLVRENMTAYVTNNILHEALDNLFWSCVKKRLGAPAIGCFGLTISSDYEIVTLPPSSEDRKIMLTNALVDLHPLDMLPYFSNKNAG